jgi:hypothetical protein
MAPATLMNKKSAINNLINRMNIYPLTHRNKDQEQTIIKEILKKNGYQQSIIHQKHKIKPMKIQQKNTKYKKKNKNGQYLHTLALKPEPLLNYFDIQISKSPTKLPTQ